MCDNMIVNRNYRILKCKDYYDILGVSRDACEDDLKKSYKKVRDRVYWCF